VTQQLAAGELAVVAPNVWAVVEPLKSQGAKIDFAAPEITTGNEFVTVLAKGSASANAAKCLYNFLFTTEGQKAYNGETSVSPMGVAFGGMPLPANYIDPKLTELPAQEKALLDLLRLNK
jgi:iron(III) transport system substrate-binding protein